MSALLAAPEGNMAETEDMLGGRWAEQRNAIKYSVADCRKLNRLL